MKRRALLGGAVVVTVLALEALARSRSNRRSRSACRWPRPAGLPAAARPRCCGIEIWRDEINTRGGLLGRKVELGRL